MNKKKLSVVMAGAMLASSVAPVLAAEVQKSEVSANEKGLLLEELRTLIETNTFANDSKNKKGSEDFRGKSVYRIFINGDEKSLDVGSTQEDWQREFNDLTSGDTIKVYSKGFKEVDGKNYHYEVKTEQPVYDETELTTLKNNLNTGLASGGIYENLIESAEINSISGDLVIVFKDDTGMIGDNNNSITISKGDKEIKEGLYLDASGNEQNFRTPAVGVVAVTPGEFYGFPEKEEIINSQSPISSSLVREITITPGGYDLTVEELYDGLMLTEKGHDFFTQIKEARAMGRNISIKGNNSDSPWIGYNGTGFANSSAATAIKMVGGKARFTVTFGAKGKLDEETYSITGLNEANAERLATWMIKPLARVDILAGSNRYETAVKIAKEYAGLTGETVSNFENGVAGKVNVVLVNGNALVDGLAAAPLAASLGIDSTHKAPVLLTEADALPKATKTYLKEVLANVKIGKLGKVTVHLVGGKSVLSKSLENELRGLGFTVERHGGENREETSLAVAEAMPAKSEAFLVGAEGEADAMSIAAVAAETRTPIIVAKKGGVSEDATYELRNKEVTIIGGENAVSKADYNAVKAEAKGILRIAGSNRQATNAEIIKKYYKNNFLEAENIIVAKDGKANKAELVDALAAANMASEVNAPIVLATDKLSKTQLDALILNAKKAEALYQVGHGVSRDVVKTIATQLGLTNRY